MKCWILTDIPCAKEASESSCNDFNQAKDFRPNGCFLFFILHDDIVFRVKLKVIWVRSARGWWLRGGSEVARKLLGSRSVTWAFLNVGKGTNKG